MARSPKKDLLRSFFNLDGVNPSNSKLDKIKDYAEQSNRQALDFQIQPIKPNLASLFYAPKHTLIVCALL